MNVRADFAEFSAAQGSRGHTPHPMSIFFGLCFCSSKSNDDVIRTSNVTREKKDVVEVEEDKVAVVEKEETNTKKRVIDETVVVQPTPIREPPVTPKDVVEEEKKKEDNKPIEKTITEHLKSHEYMSWAQPDHPEPRKQAKQRRGTLEALVDLGVSFDSNDSFAGPKTSKAREEEEKKKNRWNFFR